MANNLDSIDTIRDGDVARFADFDNSALLGNKGRARKTLSVFPVIDVSPFVNNGSESERRRVAREIRQVCLEIGFFYIKGHGIPTEELKALLTMGEQFFQLPLEEKLKIRQDKSCTREGYWIPGAMATTGDTSFDIKERFQYDLRHDFGQGLVSEKLAEAKRSVSNSKQLSEQWPDAVSLPGFEALVKAHVAKRATLARQMARAFALSLDLPEAFFDEMYLHFYGTFIFNYYPPIDAATLQPNQWSFSPHTDYGCITILSQDELGGLEACTRDGEWIDVPPIEGTFVVNVGDTLQMWSNDLYVSTLHRAANTNGKARISAVFFTKPQGDTVIRCLPTCHGPDNPPRYAPIVSSEYTRMLVEQAHRTGRPGVSTKTAERFQARKNQ
ncbi:MAG: isopenicillin N synthase family dioxygenase [Burkholderiales bacterium]